MFDTLSERLQAALADVRSRGALTEDDINKAKRQIRLALLEADVNFQVVKQFTSAVKERALGAEVLEALNPGQQVVKLVDEELTRLMGGAGRDLVFAGKSPTVILMAGLQGSGKTTAVGKLARHLRQEHGKDVGIAACDVYRPAAVDQLIKVGEQAGATVYEQGTGRDPVDIAEWALGQAKSDGRDVLIIDTSGRLHAGEELPDFERFHPDRMAQRILGMGDVMTLVEKAERQMDDRKAAELERKIRKEQFTLEDFLEQMQQVRNMGPLGSLLKMMPGVGSQLGSLDVDEKELDRLEAIIRSMTPEERADPKIINGSRRRRIARGPRASVQAVSQLVKQFAQMRKVMKQIAGGKMPSLQQLAGGR